MAPVTDRSRQPVWKLALLLYPFAAAAVAINLFMLGLIGTWIGLPALSPMQSLLGGAILGIPAGWACGVWLRRLMDRADGRKSG